MPGPTDVSGVRRFLRLVNQLGKFTPHLADTTKPLRDLLCRSNDWTCGHEQRRSFKALKESLASAPVFALFNAKLETTVSTDAILLSVWGPYLLLQRQLDGEIRPVAYASRAMSAVEQR